MTVINNWYPNRRANLPIGGTTYVSKQGSDGTGQRGNTGRPFLTLTAAKAASLSGDTIVVWPGTYVEHDLLKNGVNWLFMPGAVVTWNETGTGNGYGIFDDRSSGACACVIAGYGEFRMTTTLIPFLAGNPNFNGVVVVTNAASSIVMRGKRLALSTYNGEGAHGAYGVYVTNCTLVTVDLAEGIIGPTVGITSLDPGDGVTVIRDTSGGVYWELGRMSVRCPQIYTDLAYALWANEPSGSNTADADVTVERIEAIGPNTPGIYMSAKSANYRLWVNSMLISATGGGAVAISNADTSGASSGAAKLYVTAQKILGQGGGLGLDNQNWINAQKLTANGGSFITMTTTAAISFIAVLQYEDGGVTQGTGVTGGKLTLLGGMMKITNGKGLGHTGGTTEAIGLTVDTSNTNNAANHAVSVSGAGLTLRQCHLIAPALANSVNAGSAQTISAYGVRANQVMNANVTVQNDKLELETVGRVTGSDATTTGQVLVDVTGLSVPLIANGVFEFEAVLSVTTSAVVTGTQYGVQFSAAGGAVEAQIIGSLTSTAAASERVSALNTATTNAFLTTSAQSGQVLIKGIATTGVNAGNLTIRHLKVTSGTSTVRINSFLKVRRIA